MKCSPLLPLSSTENPTQLLIALNLCISKLTNTRQHSQSLRLFAQLHSCSPFISPDHYSLASALKSCAHLPAPDFGPQLHSFALRCGLTCYPHVSNSLLSFYAKTHSLDVARKLFDSIPSPDVYSYTTLLSAHAKNGCLENALQLFDGMPKRTLPVWNALITGLVNRGSRGSAVEFFVSMHRMGVGFDRYTFASVLSICDSVELVGFGQQVHSVVIRTGFLEFSVAVVNALMSMYFDCGVVRDGVSVFREASVRDVITYNGLIAGLASLERDDDALMVFKELMGREENWLRPTELTCVSVLGACYSKNIGEQVYGQVIKMGMNDSLVVGNAAVTMCSDYGDMVSARKVFEIIHIKDVVSWNSMISGYSREDQNEAAIELYRQMLIARTEPDEFTYGSLVACFQIAKHVNMLQAVVVKSGLIMFTEVCNALISAYAKCEELHDAYRIFDEMSFKNLISWNSIILGSLLNGLPMQGLRSFYNLLNSGFEPNSRTLTTVLGICSIITTLRFGAQIHCYVLKDGSCCEVAIGNSLITMYTKCGDLDSSYKVFCGMCQKDLVSWNAIIAAYSQNGDGHQAINYFKVMLESGILPDHATFTVILSACSHAGLVEEGYLIFARMIKDYGLEPQLDHYTCVIDLLSRAGRLEEAQRLISSMPYSANSQIWWSVLSSCSTYGDARLGRIAARFLLEVEPENTAVHILLSNINAAHGMWEEASSIREHMRNKGVVKMPGCSWTEPGH